MNLTDFNKLADDLLATAKTVRDRKRKDYAAEHDVLSNFKDDGRDARLTAEQAWTLHTAKQWSAIRALMLDPAHDPAEPSKQRFCDMINYALLGYALWKERNGVVKYEVVGPTEGTTWEEIKALIPEPITHEEWGKPT